MVPFDSMPLLATLRPDDRAALEPLCRMHDYEKGEPIFHEGDPADRIFFIYAGRVKIVKSAGARDVILEILGPGEPVGAVAAFEQRPFPASAIAIEPSGLVSIPEREFFQLLERRPDMTRRMLAGLTMRLMMLNKRFADMTGSAESRAARLFLTLAERLGIKEGKGVSISLALSRQDLADLLGTTLETAIRLMSRWQKDGLLLTEKSGFRIPDLEAIRELAQSGR
jgi:CRP/FNR family transcriptional regulator, nitrogen oxide reductase regulator